jgi:NADH-quinone oxidoreductase subunit N
LLLFFGALGTPPPGDHPYLFKILAVIGVLNAAIGAWYYLRVIATMYLRPPVKPIAKAHAWPGMVALISCALATLIFGSIYSEPLRGFANQCVAVSNGRQALR